MSNRLKSRIVSAVFEFILMFMMFCIIYKLLNPREDWLSYSAIWSGCWTIGKFIAETIYDEIEENFLKAIVFEIVILLLVVVVIAFIVGVVISMDTWREVLADFCVPFGCGMFLQNVFNQFKDY